MGGGRTAAQLGQSAPFEPEELLGDLAHPGGPLTLEAFPYAFGSPATAGLYRLHGPGWSWFGKVLQHVRHWPGLALIPPEHGDHFAATYPWRSELELWEEPYVGALPEGMRPPVLHGLVDLGDDRLAIWMEHVIEAPPEEDLARFDRAARLLGRWNARCSDPAIVAGNDYPVGYALRLYAETAVPQRGLAPLDDDELWSHPWLAGHAGLRGTLQRLGTELPAMLDRLDGHVQCIPHGDASPQNLMVPADDPETFVVIDVSFRTPHALGFDLGQLLVGLTHAGLVPASMLGGIAERIVPAYVAGLEAEGIHGAADAAVDAFVTSALVRSGFDSFLYGLIGSDDDGRPARLRRAGGAVRLPRRPVPRRAPGLTQPRSTREAIHARSAAVASGEPEGCMTWLSTTRTTMSMAGSRCSSSGTS